MNNQLLRIVGFLSLACSLLAGAASNAQEDWDQVLAAAKKEGKVVVSGAPGELWREALTVPFQKKYPQIQVEFSAHNGRDFWPKVRKERQVEQYLWDLRIGGPDATSSSSSEMLLPVRPVLLPENADTSKWLGGLEGLFVDKDNSYIPGFLATALGTVTVNRDIIPEKELSSPEQVLNPKFKGKIVLNDPRGGAGLGSLTVLLKAYGEDFVRKLLTHQDVVVTRDNRQLIEWVIRGKYPIAVGDDSANLATFQKQGLGRNVKQVKAGVMKLSTGFGCIMYLDRAPHPNAAKVYINWLLSREGQAQLTRIVKLNSRRLDVPPADPNSVVDPKRLDQYVPHQHSELIPVRARARELAFELIK